MSVPPPPSTPIKRDEKYKARRKVIDELTAFKAENSNNLLQFVQRTSVQTYTAIDQLREIMKGEFKQPNAEYVRDGKPPPASDLWEGTDFGEQYFFTNPRIETGDERYAWVNTTFFIGEGHILPGLGVEYRVWRPA